MPGLRGGGGNENQLLEGSQDENEAARLFQQAVDLREVIFRILSAVAAAPEVSEADANALNGALQELNADSLVVPGPGQIAWRWVEESSGRARLLGRIVRSAVKLLTPEDIERVKQCAAEKCCWLFIDGSRNRRWCEMRAWAASTKRKRSTRGRPRQRKRATNSAAVVMPHFVRRRVRT